MLHYVYVGHFERDAEFIRFAPVSDEKPVWYRPVIHRPIQSDIVRDILLSKGVESASEIPEEWGVYEDAGFFVWERFSGEEAARDFIKQLALRSGCDLADYSTLTFMNAWDL